VRPSDHAEHTAGYLFWLLHFIRVENHVMPLGDTRDAGRSALAHY
jgi:hypothetical protein